MVESSAIDPNQINIMINDFSQHKVALIPILSYSSKFCLSFYKFHIFTQLYGIFANHKHFRNI